MVSELLDNLDISTDIIHDPFLTKSNISLSVLRLDKIDPEISGNKIFKLWHYLYEASGKHKKVITFGGPYSNHLAATSAACNKLHIDSIGIVRGQMPAIFPGTLSFCKKNGMQLLFVSREEYNKKENLSFGIRLKEEFGDHVLVPEGGFGPMGLLGAQEIVQHYHPNTYTHICCPVGTGTTIAGLMKASDNKSTILGFSALKGLNDFKERMNVLLDPDIRKNYSLNNDYHFGGFAKSTSELFEWMNSFYRTHKIPTDFVYTGKMMFGVYDLIKNHYFKKGSSILCIHTGGLQGNNSLPENTLCF